MLKKVGGALLLFFLVSGSVGSAAEQFLGIAGPGLVIGLITAIAAYYIL